MEQRFREMLVINLPFNKCQKFYLGTLFIYVKIYKIDIGTKS
jgi:hypothetical protein